MGQVPREIAERAEETLSKYAAKSYDAGRAARREYPQLKDDFRTEFQRDYTRILHSRAFRRLRHKTQVFIHPQNDHICTRLEHSLHVASIAKTTGRALGLDLELIDAISLGHDLGHAPFGHKGEEALDRIARKRGLTYQHEQQSLRVVDMLESPYEEHPGLNLTFAVRDGIVMHNGEDYGCAQLAPEWQRGSIPTGVSGQEHRPATLEGCVVRWADRIAYVGRDFEDAVDANIITKEDLPEGIAGVLGRTNREFIATLVRDIVEHSRDKEYIAVNGEVRQALREFHDFSTESIYKNEEVTACFAQIDRAIQEMFSVLLDELEQEKVKSRADLPKTAPEVMKVLADFLHEELRTEYEEEPPQKILDFLGGMTDSFFIKSYTELFLPHSTA